MFRFQYQNEKKWEKNLGYITGNKEITHRSRFQELQIRAKRVQTGAALEISNRNKMITSRDWDFKSGQRDFKSGKRLQIGTRWDFKSGQGLQIVAEQT